jgi:hypothetical protein
MKYFFAFIIIISIAIACAASEKVLPINDETDLVLVKEDFSLLYYHEHDRYSILVNKDDELESLNFNQFQSSEVSFKIKIDVKEGDSNWYEMRYRTSSFKGLYDIENSYVILHISDPKEVKGGNWNHGKFGQVTTTAIL